MRPLRRRVLPVYSVLAVSLLNVPSLGQSRDQIAPSLANAHREFTVLVPRHQKNSKLADAYPAPALDTIRTFSGEYQAPGVDGDGIRRNSWFYTMAGSAPEQGGTTVFDAPVVPVSLDLLDSDGSLRQVNGQPLHSSVRPFVDDVLNSPIFQSSDYTSSDIPTQFSDAVQRAEFYSLMLPDWHTLLRPRLRQERILRVPRGKYFFALNGDGSCCAFVLVDIKTFAALLFPGTAGDPKSPVGAAESAGDITSADISTFLFPNTYLYLHGDPNQCCVVGFHTYDSFPGTAANDFREKRYVLNYSSWISSGVFAPGFEDVTALSHEISESLNDPFVGSDGLHGITPWWRSPNGNCQDDLEVGDVIEGLPNATVAIRSHGHTYHPQNEALLEWFEFQSPSFALAGAYSFPDENVLTELSSSQGVNCR
ncbi:MAG: hypothetical protein JO356_10760 [Acidobacteria bacterium]|nr:hypothetical protein [Acidobacteriota bacterium]